MAKERRSLLVAFLDGTTPIFASGPSFRPDTTMDGSVSRAGTHLDRADWRAEKGELVERPRQEYPVAGWCSPVLSGQRASRLSTAAAAVVSRRAFPRGEISNRGSRGTYESWTIRIFKRMTSPSMPRGKFSSETASARWRAGARRPSTLPQFAGTGRRWGISWRQAYGDVAH